jgi:hypothetical protein
MNHSASEMRDEGSQRCNLWITVISNSRGGAAPRISARLQRPKITIDFRYQTFHVWLPSHRGSAAIDTLTVAN